MRDTSKSVPAAAIAVHTPSATRPDGMNAAVIQVNVFIGVAARRKCLILNVLRIENRLRQGLRFARCEAALFGVHVSSTPLSETPRPVGRSPQFDGRAGRNLPAEGLGLKCSPDCSWHLGFLGRKAALHSPARPTIRRRAG